MPRSVRLYTAAQFEEVKTMVDLLAERSDLPPAERDRLSAFQVDLRQTVREDRRRAVASHLLGCAAATDAVLIASELAANAILHSRSRAGHFTVRTELHPDHVQIEAEDLGGPWRRRQPDGRPHGLDVVEALIGPDGWGTEITTSGARLVWARLDLDAGGESGTFQTSSDGRQRP